MAFVAAYRGGIEDDNAEFEHLQSEDVVMASDDEDSERMEIVSTTIVQKQLRAAANQHADVVSIFLKWVVYPRLTLASL